MSRTETVLSCDLEEQLVRALKEMVSPEKDIWIYIIQLIFNVEDSS